MSDKVPQSIDQDSDAEPLEDVFGIDPDSFHQTFAEYWQKDHSAENRVHVETVVEREVEDAIRTWGDRVHAEAENGDTQTGLFLIVEGAQATGKTTMTRYIRDQLDPLKYSENTGEYPIIFPVWVDSQPNPSPVQYLDWLREAGERYIEGLDVPQSDEKIEDLRSIGADLSDDLREKIENEGIDADDFWETAEKLNLLGGDREPADVLEQLAKQGYVFVFLIDEMVPEHKGEEAQSILKWFEKHLNPNVGFVMFSHPNVSSITRDDMFDQMRRRNGDIKLDIANEEYQLNENHVISIRGKQHELIDLSYLLLQYFEAVYPHQDHDPYGPLSESQVKWLEKLLSSHGLVGNLIDGIRAALEEYAADEAFGEPYGGLGAYLFDECDRSMKSIRLKVAFRAVTDLDPDDRTETVATAKELITKSKTLEDVNDELKNKLSENRVLIEEEGELTLHPELENPDFGVSSEETEPGPQSRERLIDVYNRKAEEYEQEYETGDREDLRVNVEDSIIEMLDMFGMQRANISESVTLSAPGLQKPSFDTTTFTRGESRGRAHRIEPSSGGIERYKYRYLTYTLFNDESLADSKIKDDIQSLYKKDTGIIIFTDQDDVSTPDWFDEPLNPQRTYWDADFTWGDVIEVISVENLGESWALHETLEERNIETVADRLARVENLSRDYIAPDLYTHLWDTTDELHEAAIAIHSRIYEEYGGPNLNEAEALSNIVDLIKETGFVTTDQLNDLRDKYRHEIGSLISDEGIYLVEGTDTEFVVLDDDYGDINVLLQRKVQEDPRNLHPLSPAVIEELQNIAEMVDDLSIQRQDSDIENALESLEDARELIDHFLVNDAEYDRLIEEMDGVDALETVHTSFETTKDKFTREVHARIVDLLEQDRAVWDEIKDIEDANVSEIHRALFYARLKESPSTNAMEYLEEDDDYPGYFHETSDSVRDDLHQLQSQIMESEKEYDEQTASLDETLDEISTFVKNGGNDDE